MFNLNEVQAADAVAKIKSIASVRDDVAMMAYVNLFGAEAVQVLYEDPGCEDHDSAWNALGALKFWAK